MGGGKSKHGSGPLGFIGQRRTESSVELYMHKTEGDCFETLVRVFYVRVAEHNSVSAVAFGGLQTSRAIIIKSHKSEIRG